MVRLTCRKILDLRAGLHVEFLEVGEISEAFGHHISKIRNQENKRCNNVSHFQEESG